MARFFGKIKVLSHHCSDWAARNTAHCFFWPDLAYPSHLSGAGDGRGGFPRLQCPGATQTKGLIHDLHSLADCARGRTVHRLRHCNNARASRRRCGFGPHAGNFRRGARRRRRLSQAPVPRPLPWSAPSFSSSPGFCWAGIFGNRLPDRRGPFGRCRLHRHERVGARQRARRHRLQRSRWRAVWISPSSQVPSPACSSQASAFSA